jgi:WD40 repeat protein
MKTFKGHTDWVWSVAFSPDGTELASTGNEGFVRLWDIGRGVERLAIRADGEDMIWVDFSRDGREVIAREEHGKFRVWDRSTGTPLRIVQLDKERVWKPVLSPDGRSIAAAVESGVVLLDYATFKIIRRIPSSTGGMWEGAFSRDGQLLAWSSANHAHVFSLASDEMVATFDHAFATRGVDFSPDGRYLVTSDDGNNIHLWDIEHRARRAVFHGHDHWVMMVRFSPDGQTIGSVSNDGTVRLWRGAAIGR